VILRRSILLLLALTGFATHAAAQSDERSWFVAAEYGRTSYERPFVAPAFPCFKPCLIPDIARGSTATFLFGRAIGSVISVHASVSPFLDKSTRVYYCSGHTAPSTCTPSEDFRRWLEYRVAVEAGGSGHVRPFLGAAVGGAAYRWSTFSPRDHRLIWDARAGVETTGAVGVRLELSRTQHLNPRWDADENGKESFADWQLKGGLRVGFGR
jgi:hypothetical protein